VNIALMQPTFMPWLGYFELILKSERFVFLDDFQFSAQSYHQRNRIFTNNDHVDWCTVPVRKSSSFCAPINDVLIIESAHWRKKLWKQIDQNYRKAPFYLQLAPLLQTWLFNPSPSLARMNIEFIQMVCELMGIQREMHLSSEFPSSSYRSIRVLELLRYFEADHYLCPNGSFSYMLEDGVFPVDDVDVCFQNYVPKPYPQLGSSKSFIAYLSIIDALMNIGSERTLQLVADGTESWLSWAQMCRAYDAI